MERVIKTMDGFIENLEPRLSEGQLRRVRRTWGKAPQGGLKNGTLLVICSYINTVESYGAAEPSGVWKCLVDGRVEFVDSSWIMMNTTIEE